VFFIVSIVSSITRYIIYANKRNRQAYDIVRLTGKQVFCTEKDEIINPEFFAGSFNCALELTSKVKADPFAAVIKIPRFLKKEFDKIRCRIIAEVKKRKSSDTK